MDRVIPKPVSAAGTDGVFTLTASTSIRVSPANDEMLRLGRYLADRLNPATGYVIRVSPEASAPAPGDIILALSEDPSLGEEGYRLAVAPEAVTLTAPRPAGIFWGIQTIRQLLPPAIEGGKVQSSPWTMPAGAIMDRPRFAWRGAMLDVARHFYGVREIERFLDLMAYYKLNRLHLHLTDDQGWRIMIESWPRLALRGGKTAVGGGRGGYYTQEQYAGIVAYARDRFITIVPEIDLPGHTNAALASYAELNCTGKAPPLYTGTRVGLSSLCLEKEITRRFVRDVLGEIAALTPGPYLHIGGDEAKATKEADYISFIGWVQEIVAAHGKQAIGWEEIAKGELAATSIVQHWRDKGLAVRAAARGARVIMSPASRVYLDMKYDPSTSLGLTWAGCIDVPDAYAWEPAAWTAGVSEANILGVEAPLWTETIRTMAELEYMAFPRLPGVAEIGWSQAAGRSWLEYRIRLGAHGPRLRALGINYHPSKKVPWG
ncbi:MAG: beta-N-acetylhexosaminidase [Patescibacteria group bacterium]